MTVLVREGNYPHISWIDLNGDGTMIECAIVREVADNIYYIQLDRLDSVDKKRMVRIIGTRNADNFELWDLMSTVTLGNGVNALKYFHQLVRVITPEGRILRPSMGRQGVQLVDTESQAAPTADEMQMAEELLVAGREAGVKTKRKPGRPKKPVAA